MLKRWFWKLRKLPPKKKLEVGLCMITISVIWKAGLQGTIMLLLFIMGSYIVISAGTRVIFEVLDEYLGKPVDKK